MNETHECQCIKSKDQPIAINRIANDIISFNKFEYMTIIIALISG